MQNLKIKIGSESEAEEVKRLAVKAGYTLDALFGKKWSADFCYLVLYKDMSAGFGNEIMADGDKPLSIGELRAMSNPMKEYLVPQNAGGFMYKKAYESKSIPDSWIEIPDGAEVATLDGKALYFWKPSENKTFVDDHWVTCGTDVCSFDDFTSDERVLVIWQRATHPEELPFIDDEPKYTDDEVKYMDENGQGRLQSINDQYAEIDQVRQAINKSWGSVGSASGGAAQASGGVDATLTERQSQYGCYEDVAHVTQQILSALRIGNYDELPAPMKESLHMIASKMARIVNGDPEYLDNWHDIGGYAKLIEKLIKGE